MRNELLQKLYQINMDKQAHLLPSNLKKGVTVLGITGTLEESTKVNGATDVTVLANEDIQKGDVCGLQKARGNFQASVAEAALPTQMMTNAGSYSPLNLSNTNAEGYTVHASCGGKLVFIPAQSYTYFVPFYLKDGKYVQLKVDGSWSTDWGVTSNKYTYQNYGYDDENKILFYTYNRTITVYKLDEEANNLVTQTSYTESSTAYPMGQTIYAKNNNAIVNWFYDSNNNLRTFLYRYDPETNQLETRYEPIGYFNTTSQYLGDTCIDYAPDLGNGVIYCVMCKYNMQSSSKYNQVYVRKLTYDATTGKYAAGTASSVTIRQKYRSLYIRRNSYGTVSNSQIDLHGSILYLLDESNTLHLYNINPTTMDLEEATLEFSDGLDKTKIDSFSLIKELNYIYVLSTDTTLDLTKRLRLYKYNKTTQKLDFICCPAEDTFNPVLNYSQVPVYSSLIFDGTGTLALTSGIQYKFYDATESAMSYEYFASPANNLLSESNTAYGIADGDISKGTTGEVSKILG